MTSGAAPGATTGATPGPADDATAGRTAGADAGGRVAATTALGTRPVGRLLWHACTQTTLSVGVYGVYALTNAWFVARGVGPTAVAAVNLVAPLLLALGALATALGVGAASVVSRRLGAGDPAGAARATGNAFTVFWLAALATTGVGLTFLDPLLHALGARGATLPYARDYAVVVLAGAIVSTGFSAVVRAEGRLRFSVLLWVVPVVVQIVLDPLLIYGAGLGVRGAALGTVGGQAVSAAMSVWFFFLQRGRPYRVRAADLRPHAPTVGTLLGIGSPSFLAGAGTTLLVVVVNTGLARTAGAAALAAYAICARLQTFVQMPQLGISQGMQPVVGYNAGAGLTARAWRARVLTLRATLLYGLLAGAATAALAEPVVAVFVDAGPTRTTAVDALRVLAVGFAAAGVSPLVAAYFQALGRPRPAYLLTLGTLVVVKVPLVLGLGAAGPTGTWVALAAGEVVGAVVALVVLRLRDPLRGVADEPDGGQGRG
ncbi:MATE family efflux transporter [Cellulomonas sp. HD19AZ1]|uniref:MATE family efflux transporter n=1 Tax=Cellulomonas sp. HD19AZ1 TaxID=2559593 RepID=UPI0010715023|nr:MATE family efflux transporter [Cellulomonas sp. HD19AZ1]TFH69830.1 MATE family efflux transporter [Cellulomonas sp. HD19AZ1]